MRNVLRYVVTALLCAPAFAPAKATDSLASASSWLSASLPGKWAAPDHFVWHSPNDPANWKFGGYAGKYSHDSIHRMVFVPWKAYQNFAPAYIVAANATYSAVELPYIPASIDVEFVAAGHFGGRTFAEFAFAPVLRWKWFPWNDFVYTNFRVGPLGASYVTRTSLLEAGDTRRFHTSRFLNYLTFEWTFAPSAESKFETFVRLHHRCGIWGLVNGVNGGSNYVTAGFRTGF